MKINNLLEATGPVIAFCWGRFQPPHLGHAQVFKKVASVGKDGYYICTSQSQDPKKNPLDYATKIALIKEMFPQYADHVLYDPKVKTIYDALTAIYNKMDPKVAEQTTLVFVGDPERIGDFQEGFRKYNGQQMRTGYYKFKDVTTFPNTDAADIRATDVRSAASSGDFNKFMELTGTKGALAKKVYNAVRAGMGVDNKKAVKEDVGYNFYELLKGPTMMNLYDKMHHARMKNKDMLKYVLDNIWYMKKIDPNTLRSIRSKFYQDPFGRNLHIDDKQIQHYVDLMKHYQHVDPVIIGPSGSIIDGNHRVRAAAKLGVPVVAYVAVNENVAKKDLDAPTPTVKDLAKKYRVTTQEVNLELAKGIKVEMEHTTDVEVAREIALDHLNEKLDYYTELANVEKTEEAWSRKYKNSINCNNPKGFSQRAHCAGRAARRAGKKTKSQSVNESEILERKRKRRAKNRVRYGYFPWFFGTGSTDTGAEGGDGGGESINELANEPYRYMLWKRTMMGNSYLFQTDAGVDMVVSVVPETLADGRHRVEIMFADKATFGLEKTGKGDAFRIFATVAQILKDYIKQAEHPVDEIFFSGKTKEPSRIKLYDKISRRLGNYVQGFEFVGAGDNGVEKGYFFQKPVRNADEEVIKEVTMNPSALANFAKTDVAKSMTVGFEAEMAFDDMADMEPDYDNVEPDFDADENISFGRDWRRQVERFFTSGESNNSRRDVAGVLETVDEDYMEWIEEQYQDWLKTDEAAETITKKLKDYDEDISDEDIEDTIKFKKNNYWGSIEDDVREDWNDDNMNDEAFIEFMEYNEMDTMRGLYDRFTGDLTWPYYTEPELVGGRSYEEVEMSFVETTGYRAKVSSGYHSAKREPGVWIFEPDSSIEPSGVELVSPPMPLDEGLKALDDFFAWAKGYGAEANESTGFHMGVSIPGQTMENIDHLKLIIFLGDEYVLSQFGRSNNSFTKSSLAKIRTKIDNGEVDALEVMNAFKQGLNSEAAKTMGGNLLPKGNRYVSVNIKENYIEFRSAGGNYFEKIPEIKNTMLRYVRAMAIAADPQAEKNEYAKKLYKMLSDYFPKEFETIKFFSKYVSGQFNREDLKDVLKSVQQGRADLRAGGKPAPVKTPAGMQTYTVTYRDLNGNEGQVNVKAENIVTAYNVFTQKYPAYIYKDIKLATSPQDAEQQRQQAAAASNITAGGQTQWEVYRRNNNQVLHRFSAPDQNTAWTQGGAWARANGYADQLEQLSVRQASSTNESLFKTLSGRQK